MKTIKINLEKVNKTYFKNKKILLFTLLLLIPFGITYSDNQLDVKTYINNMRNSTQLPGIIGDIFIKIFDTNGKIKSEFLSINKLDDLSDSISDNTNIFVGTGAGINNSTGTYNTSIGIGSLNTNIYGSGNVALGYQAGFNETGSNKLYIDNSSTNNPLIYGNFLTDKLTINGSLKIGVATDTTCDLVNEGSIRYDNVGKHFYGCNGTNWLQLDN